MTCLSSFLGFPDVQQLMLTKIYKSHRFLQLAWKATLLKSVQLYLLLLQITPPIPICDHSTTCLCTFLVGKAPLFHKNNFNCAMSSFQRDIMQVVSNLQSIRDFHIEGDTKGIIPRDERVGRQYSFSLVHVMGGLVSLTDENTPLDPTQTIKTKKEKKEKWKKKRKKNGGKKKKERRRFKADHQQHLWANQYATNQEEDSK